MSLFKRLTDGFWGYLGEQAAHRGHSAPQLTPYARIVPPPGSNPDPAGDPSSDPAAATPKGGAHRDRLVAADPSGDRGGSGHDDDPSRVTPLPQRPPQEGRNAGPGKPPKRKLRKRLRWAIAALVVVVGLFVFVSCVSRGGSEVYKAPIAIAPKSTTVTAKVPAALIEKFNQFPSVYTEGDQVKLVGAGLQALDALAVEAKIVSKAQSTQLPITEQDTAECPAGNVDTRLYNIRYCATDGTFWISDQPGAGIHDKIVRDFEANRFPMLADMIGAYARYVIEGDRGIPVVTGGARVAPSNWHCTVGQITAAIKPHYKISDQEMNQITTGFSEGAKKAYDTGYKKGRCAVETQ